MMHLSLLTPNNHDVVSQHTAEQDSFSAGTNSVDGSLDWLNLIRSEKEDGTAPAGILFSWTPAADVPCTVECAEDSGFHTGKLSYPAAAGTSETVGHSLKTGTRYFWRIVCKRKVVSETGTFQTKNELPRWIRAEGISNVRDCGGWKTKDGKTVRQGVFFRGGEMNNHMTITKNGIKFLEKQLRIRTLLDLRGQKELNEVNGKGSMLSKKVQWINIRLLSYTSIFSEEQITAYANAFRVLLNKENYPLYVHCWGGADRTGIFVFLINAVLGVPDEDLFHDYELTSLSIWAGRSRNSEYFQSFREELRQYAPDGDLEKQAAEYLKRGGITDEELHTLKDIFLY